MLFIFAFFPFLNAADSRSYPVTATYCDGSTLDIYPFSLVTKDDGSTFNCYEVMASAITDGYRYGFEDKDDADYDDVVVDLYITGNNTSSPVAHIKFVSKEASYKHWIYVVYNGNQQLVFQSEQASVGAVFDIPLPVKSCADDFEIQAEPHLRTINQGESTFYTITVKASEDFSDDVTLIVEGLPAGVTGVFQPNPLSVMGESKLDIVTNADTTPGTYQLTIKGMVGEEIRSDDVTLEIRGVGSEPDFTLEAEPLEQSLYAGESVDYELILTALNGFSRPVQLYIEGLPDGVSADFQPGILKPSGNVKLTVKTKENAPTGAHKLTVAARGGGLKRKVEITLTVKEMPLEPDFEISITPAVQELYRGESAKYNIALTALNEFSQEVTLEVSGVPGGTGVAFNKNSVVPDGESLLTITPSDSTPLGDHVLTVTAKGGEKEHSASVKLTVKCRNFSVKIEKEPTKGPAPLTVQFNAVVENNSESNINDYQYSWNFNDGNTSKIQNPEHTFHEPGVYQVVLSVTNGCGKTQSATTAVEVIGFDGSISKSFSTSEALPGDELYITIEVKNGTRFNFKNVTIRDELSQYLEYLEDDASSTVQRSGQELKWFFQTLEKNETLHFNIKVKVSENAPQVAITNVAFLSHDSLGQGKNISSNVASLTVRQVDVLFQKVVEQTSAKPGDLIKYKLIIKNNSDIPLTGIKLTDELSDHLDYDYQSGGLDFQRQGRYLQWSGTIAAQQQEVIVLKARVKSETFSGTRIRNQARLEAAELRTSMDSNTVETSISSEPVSTTAVQFTKRSDIPQAEVGRVVRFTITITNRSTSGLISPVIEDYLPQGFSYVASTTLLNNRKYTEPQGTRRLLWQLPSIGPSETVVLRYQVVIGTDVKRGLNTNRAILRAVDNSGQDLVLEAMAGISVSSSSFIFYSGVEGTVYLDMDNDDFFSMADTPLQGIEVRLSTGEKIFTDGFGNFRFESLFPGEYAVGVNTATLPEKYKLASPYPKVVVLADGLTDTVDFAVKFQGDDEVGTARLQGRVFYDKNRNKAFEKSDPLAEKFTVHLDESLVATGNNGTFVFTHLKPGKHTIKIIYGLRTLEKEITLKQGKNYIDIPLIFSGIKIIIKGEEQ